jgi:sulfate adenylyltransferase subunit 1 (EFTu-like GTPase family)
LTWLTAISAPKRRKFIIGDAPGHEQYTRNMVTAASSADAAVVLVDAIKLDWKNPALELLPQTRRHALLVNLLRVPSIVFAINKLDAVVRSKFGISQHLQCTSSICRTSAHHDYRIGAHLCPQRL